MNLLNVLAEQGLHVSRRGQNIIVKPAEKLTDDLRVLILEHKPELLDMLPDMQSELVRVVFAVAAYHAFTPEQTQEALEIASGDVNNALICFRALAAKAGLAR